MLTDRDILQSIEKKLDELNSEIKELRKFQLTTPDKYVTQKHCEKYRQSCHEHRRERETNLKWGIGTILVIGSIVVTILVAIGSWAINIWTTGK